MKLYALVTFLHQNSKIFQIDKEIFFSEEEALREKGERSLRNAEYKFALMTFNATDARLI